VNEKRQKFTRVAKMEEPGKMPLRFLRLPDVEHRTGLRHSQIHHLEKSGRFPKRIKISDRASGWIESEIEEWSIARIARSRLTA
jgi:prophage regulatory protein